MKKNNQISKLSLWIEMLNCRDTAVNNALRKREEFNPFYRQDLF